MTSITYKEFPTLFKKTSKGEIQTWKIDVEGHITNAPASYTTVHGRLNGKMQETTVEVDKGKNIGKANETTPFEQACLEAESKWKKQKDKGYVENMALLSAVDVMAGKPMLAHKFEDYGHKIKYPCWVQPKLDGLRCIASKDQYGNITFTSRQGKTFENLDHIKESLKNLPCNTILDGELYHHDIDFQTIVSLIKRKQPNTERIEYHVYDTIIGGNTFDERYDELINMEMLFGNSVQLVETIPATNEDEVNDAHDHYVAAGYEGCIVRHGDCFYKEGYRSQELLKVKSFMDAEFKIVDVTEGIGKCKGQAIFTCVYEDRFGREVEFNCKIKGTDDFRRQIFLDKAEYLGKMLTVKFFDWTDSEIPLPRFPVGIALRDYE